MFDLDIPITWLDYRIAVNGTVLVSDPEYKYLVSPRKNYRITKAVILKMAKVIVSL